MIFYKHESGSSFSFGLKTEPCQRHKQTWNKQLQLEVNTYSIRRWFTKYFWIFLIKNAKELCTCSWWGTLALFFLISFQKEPKKYQLCRKDRWRAKRKNVLKKFEFNFDSTIPSKLPPSVQGIIKELVSWSCVHRCHNYLDMWASYVQELSGRLSYKCLHNQD